MILYNIILYNIVLYNIILLNVILLNDIQHSSIAMDTVTVNAIRSMSFLRIFCEKCHFVECCGALQCQCLKKNSK
jgi:hypothetical protein